MFVLSVPKYRLILASGSGWDIAVKLQGRLGRKFGRIHLVGVVYKFGIFFALHALLSVYFLVRCGREMMHVVNPTLFPDRGDDGEENTQPPPKLKVARRPCTVLLNLKYLST